MQIKKTDLVRVFIKGGIISPGDLLRLIETAQSQGTEYVHFGSRQDLLFPVEESKKSSLIEAYKEYETEYEINEFHHQNIVSSYVALDIMPNRKWLIPHVYHYILDSFDYRPSYRINVVDPLQSLVPLFTGNINFIASDQDNFWHLYLRFNELGSEPVAYGKVIYGYDLAKVGKLIENLRPTDKQLTYQELFAKIDELQINRQNPTEDLVFPDANFPYYEGLNREPAGTYWLGLYWRNNQFTLKFLSALCKRCLQTNVGKISLTPWKSFVVKHIEEQHKVGWEKLVGAFGINLRHSSLELNWHLPVLDQTALDLKTYLVRSLDQQDISTSGLTFTIKTSSDIYLFTSVVIEFNENQNGIQTYNILYSKDFNPNSGEYFTYAAEVVKEILPALLIELSFVYYEQLEETPVSQLEAPASVSKPKSPRYQCQDCKTVYDERYGDEYNDIQPGVSFANLPTNYTCPTCESAKNRFVEI